MGPFQNMIGGRVEYYRNSCFCEHCRAKALARAVSVERAQQGYRRLDLVPRRREGPAPRRRLFRHRLAAAAGVPRNSKLGKTVER
jgi:hypothetical protein